DGKKLRGRWALVRMRGKSEKQDPWLLIKEKDEFARTSDDYSVVDALPDSVSHAQPPPAALPATFKPQLATLADAPPGDPDDWLFEIKFDGYRMLARVDASKVQLITRNGHDWTQRL